MKSGGQPKFWGVWPPQAPVEMPQLPTHYLLSAVWHSRSAICRIKKVALRQAQIVSWDD